MVIFMCKYSDGIICNHPCKIGEFCTNPGDCEYLSEGDTYG